MSRLHRIALLCCFLVVGLPATASALSDNKSPTSEEVSPAEWRRQQLAAADKSDEIMHKAQKQPGLLAQYMLMQSSYDANNDRAFRLIFGQYLSWFQTWIGDYDGARKSFSIAQPAQPDDAPSPVAGGWRMRAADEVILELAKGRRAVFFNEAHSAPITRTLTVELLARLRKEGYNTFAAETLYIGDRDLQQRGYAIPKTGFYTSEPIYGEMVREAIRLGYKVVAYDAESAGVGDPREKEGAQTLANLFKRDAGTRLVVNAGFAHIQKSGTYLRGSSVATFFHKLSGIEPLAIEQTMMIEHAREDQNHPWYNAAKGTAHPNHPWVFVNDSGAAWTLKPGLYDVSVFFPPPSVTEGRPDWVSLDGMRQVYTVASDTCRGQFPCLIEARHAGESEEAVAADRVVLNVIDPSTPLNERLLSGHSNSQSRLYLYPGDYRLSALDRFGHTITTHNIHVGATTAAANAKSP